MVTSSAYSMSLPTGTPIAMGVAAERARIDVGDVVANRTVCDALLHLAHGRDQAFGIVTRVLEDVEREALRALGPDARQALELFDETNERIWQRHKSAI